MNRKWIVAAVVVLLVVIALAAIAGGFFAAAPANEPTYQIPASAVQASIGKTATSDTITLRLNSITDSSNSATRSEWATLNLDSGLYNMSLTPSPGESYLIANVTVTNAKQTQVPFNYAAFALLAPNNTAYYSNYAVCNLGCTTQALRNDTLSAGFSNDLLVLFNVPAGTSPPKLVYTISNPVIVISTGS
jgi:hypothetical protein